MTGIFLLLGVGSGVVFLRLAGVCRGARERRIWGWGLIVAAAVYVAFALRPEPPEWLLIEAGGVLAFGAVAVLGWRTSPLILALGWAVHAVWDVGLHLVGPGQELGVEWYALLCLGFDVVVAGGILAAERQVRAGVGRGRQKGT